MYLAVEPCLSAVNRRLYKPLITQTHPTIPRIQREKESRVDVDTSLDHKFSYDRDWTRREMNSIVETLIARE